MNGHVMRIAYDPMWEAVHLTVECREPEGSECWGDSGECEAAAWFVDDVENQCSSETEFLMLDGMSITVRQDGRDGGWTWAPVEQTSV